MPGRRVLITGAANFWGMELTRRLVADPEVERVVAVDSTRPAQLPAEAQLVEADLRDPGLTALLAPLGADTVIHNAVRQFRGPGVGERQLHDLNVMGTLNLLAACERMEGLRTIVVRGSAAIYGSEPGAPQFVSEDLVRPGPGMPVMRTRFQRDLAELETLFAGFAGRHPAVTCTVLRLQPVIGARLRSPITDLLRLPAVPTVLGFDPRMQFLHEDDSVAALVAAAARPVAGAVNVAGPGTVSLSGLLRRLGRVALPVPHPLFGAVVGAADRAGLLETTPDVVRYVRYGRAVDLRRLLEEVGFQPAYTTAAAIDALAAGARDPGTETVEAAA